MAPTDLLRQQVKKYIDSADDKTVQMVYALLEDQQQDDFWNELPNHVKQSIDKAIAQADAGELIPHEEVKGIELPLLWDSRKDSATLKL